MANYANPKDNYSMERYEDHWWEKDDATVRRYTDRMRGKPLSRADSYIGAYSGSYSDYWSKSSTKSEAERNLTKASVEIARVMNAVRNSNRGEKEASLSVSWAVSGDKALQSTSLTSSIIRLSPDAIVGKDGTAPYNPENVDALAGYCLLSATLRRTCSKGSSNLAQKDLERLEGSPPQIDKSSPEGRQIIRSNLIYRACETAHAKRSLLTEWPGSMPYVHRHANSALSDVEAVNRYIHRQGNTITSAVIALAFSMANPGAKLELTPEIDEYIKMVTPDVMSAPRNSVLRYAAAKQAYNEAVRIFKEEDESKGGGGRKGGGGKSENPSEDGGGESNSEGDDEGGSGDKEKEEEKDDSTPPEKKPKEAKTPKPKKALPNIDIVDGTMFGDKVTTSHSIEGTVDLTKQNDERLSLPDDTRGKPTSTKVVDYSKIIIPEYESADRRKAFQDAMIRSARVSLETQAKLRFRMNIESMPQPGMRSGELDEGSLYKLTDRHDSSPNVFTRNVIPSIPDVVAAILVDESGSMCAPCYDEGVKSNRYTEARNVCIGLNDALSKVAGVKRMIYGHDSHGTSKLRMHKYIDDDALKPEVLAHIDCRQNNFDGYAIQWLLLEMFKKHRSVRQKYLFVIADGSPHANGDDGDYCGEPAEEHVNRVCVWGKSQLGIEVYGIGIGGAPDQHTGERMYGQGKFICLRGVATAAKIISTFMARVTGRR